MDPTAPAFVEAATMAVVELLGSATTIPTVAGILGGLLGLTVLVTAGCCLWRCEYLNHYN